MIDIGFPYKIPVLIVYTNFKYKFPLGRPPAVVRSGEGNLVEKWGVGKEIKLVATLYTHDHFTA